jgi:hypothetical protein
MQERLSDEQFDVLMLAPVDAAARTSMTCMDLCAAAAYRLTGAPALKRAQESDVHHLLLCIRQKQVNLPISQAAWLHSLVASADWKLLKKARTAVTHRAIEGSSVLGVGPAATSLVIDGRPYDNIGLSRRFAQFAEAHFDAFSAAILRDFP